MATTTFDDIACDDLTATGTATFANPIHGSIYGSKSINSVPISTTVTSGSYVLLSDGTNLYRMSYADFVADLS